MLYITSKGEQIESSMTDEQAAVALMNVQQPTSFARNLVMAVANGRLTERQRPWLHKLAIEANAPAPRAEANVEVAADPFALPIFEMMQHAAARLRNPRVSFSLESGSVALYVAGERSRYRGNVMVTDGQRGGAWYGRITPEGMFVAARDSAPWLVEVLRVMANDPATFTAAYGRSTGRCCFCGRELSTDESLHVGYGPICAAHYNLPWGSVA